MWSCSEVLNLFCDYLRCCYLVSLLLNLNFVFCILRFLARKQKQKMVFRQAFTSFCRLFVNRMALVPVVTATGSYCLQDGKDKIIFATAEDHRQPPSKEIAALLNFTEEDEEPGFILPSGEINWQCPCMGGMVSGPCGYHFRQAFTCFHNSKAKPKGSDCVDLFREMSFCMSAYPTLYPHRDDDNDDEDDEKSMLPPMK